VLVALDVAAPDDEALAQAAAWATRSGAPLVACSALVDPGHAGALLPELGVTPLVDMARIEQRVKERLRARIEAATGRADVEVVVARGSAGAVILDVAERLRADLVVVGATSQGSIARVLLGSTAEQVVRQAATKVLVARPSPSAGPVVAAVDLRDVLLAPLAVAGAEARRRGVALVVVHSIEVPHPALAALEPALSIDDDTLGAAERAARVMIEGALARVEAQGEPVIVEGPAARAVMRVAEERGAALVVAGTHGRRGLSRLALGSVAASIAQRAASSVVVVPNPP
jgi:nucleotide-binding universal stress UspA family protein